MKKYRTRNGYPAVIYTENGNQEKYPIIGEIKFEEGWTLASWTKNLHHRNDVEREYDLIEVNPYEDWPIDTKVLCWNGNHKVTKFKRHFAGVGENGKALAWGDGKTSFTETCTSAWDFMELAE